MDDQGSTGGLLPERRLGEMVLLADMVTVVPPEDDNRIVAVPALIECIQDMANTGIRKRRRCQVPLHGILPLPGAPDDLECLARHGPSPGWNVIQVTLQVGGKLDLLDRVHVKEFPRCIPAQVRAIDPTGQEKRLLMLLLQEGGCPVRGLPVTGLLLGLSGRGPVNQPGKDGVGEHLSHAMAVTLFFFRTQGPMAGGVLAIPACRIRPFPMRLMKDLATRPGLVSRLAEVLWNRDRLLEVRVIT